MRVPSLASLSELRIRCVHELWCRSQKWLVSCIAVAVASSCSSNSAPSLGTSICHGCSPKKKKKEKKRNTALGNSWWPSRLRIQHCHDVGSIPNPNFCTGMAKKEKKGKKKKKHHPSPLRQGRRIPDPMFHSFNKYLWSTYLLCAKHCARPFKTINKVTCSALEED